MKKMILKRYTKEISSIDKQIARLKKRKGVLEVRVNKIEIANCKHDLVDESWDNHHNGDEVTVIRCKSCSGRFTRQDYNKFMGKV